MPPTHPDHPLAVRRRLRAAHDFARFGVILPVAADSPATAVAVVLVTYQSASDLAMCLGSLERAGGPHPLEVVVVDNASTDASVEIARGYGAKVIENPTNQGLSRAINVGVAATGAPWLLIANPDTWLSPGSLARLLATASADRRTGCAGPYLANPDGSPYPTGRRFPSLAMGAVHAALAPLWPGNPATRRYHMAGVDRRRPLAVDWVSGACMLVRRQAFEEVGGFDPGYFMYFEEMDFCLRLHRTDWRVVFDPLAEVKHVVGGSTRSAPYRKVVHHHRSALRFYCRRYARDPRLALAPLVAGFLVLRGAASLTRTAISQRREADRKRPLAGPGPDELGRPQT
jgi:N-acetylglucosaminyl-diphospho-decaprenol L-rhamnosyltransferase